MTPLESALAKIAAVAPGKNLAVIEFTPEEKAALIAMPDKFIGQIEPPGSVYGRG